MSEEFDKEAEREKLREKLEKDEQKRQETQRMSELLLQGATMTNEHCENCGDPLFRDGEETFCPTCRGAAEQPTAQGGEQTQQPKTEGQQEMDQQQQAQQPRQQAPQPPQQPQQSTNAERDRSNGTQAPERVGRQESTGEATTGDDPRLELQRAVTRSARKANEATDPRTAKQWLEASKEAAEALDALEG